MSFISGKKGVNGLCRIVFFLAVLSVFLPSQNAFALSEKGYKSLHILTKILHYVEDSYVTQVDEENLVRGAIRGMLSTLDPHSVYMAPDVYRELKVDTSGRFDGIGIEVTMRDGVLMVVSPVKGSPADDAGIQAEDKIVKINGHPTKDLNLSEAVTMMRGKRGSHVVLTILRQGVKNPFDIAVTRTIIKVPNLTWRLYDGKIGYVNITSFQSGTAHSLEKALKEMSEKSPLSGLIIDLRKNPGGLLDQAVQVADLFLDHGVIVTTENRGQEIDRREAHSENTQPDYPIVVLVDGGSASASEILAGALQDYKRATIMGTTSFGKGSVQTVIDLDDGSGLKLTIARYLTPNGRVIQDHGIVPDIKVLAKKPKTEAEEANKGKSEKEEVVIKPVQPKEDIQLEKALEYVKDPSAFSADDKPKATKSKKSK